MPQVVSTLMSVLRKGLLLVAFVSLFNVASWFGMPSQTAHAISTPDEYLQEIRKDQTMKDRQEAYKEATEITENPKMGVEKEYEAEVEEYFEEHPEEGGVLQGAKDLVNQVTGKDD